MNKIVALNVADLKYKKQQRLNTKTLYSRGKVDKVISFSPEDIDESFFKQNKTILRQTRGAGMWLWKPYFIRKVLLELEDNDILLYVDSGLVCINKIAWLIHKMNAANTDIMLFELPLIELQWTKKEIFEQFDIVDNPDFLYSNQIMGTILCFRKTKNSVSFVEKWLEICQREKLIFPFNENDKVSQYKEFIVHREDQSILSVFAKTQGVIPFTDPTDYGRFPFQYLTYNRLFRINKMDVSHQLKNVYFLLPRGANPYLYFLKYIFKVLLSKINLIVRK